MDVTIETIVAAAVEILQAAEIDPVVIWTVAVSVIAATNGWTLDEASENFGNLLDSLAP